MDAIINPNSETSKMRKYITIIIVAVAMFYIMQATGCATTSSQPNVSAAAAEDGGSWTHQNVNQVGVNLGDLASVAPIAPQAGKDVGEAVSLGVVDITPEQMKQAASKAGASFVYVNSVTVTQGVTGGADAKRAGTVTNTPGNNTNLTADNKPTTDVKLDAGGLLSPTP